MPRSQPKEKKEPGTKPAFPYTVIPNGLRSLLRQVPEKPKPPKFTQQVARAWGINDNNYTSIFSVLRALGLLDSVNQPTTEYTRFMDAETGPSVLGEKIRAVYSKLFESSKEPYKEQDQKLRNLFNIHSGGAESTLKLQTATFKVLCEFAKFDASPAKGGGETDKASNGADGDSAGAGQQRAAIHIDLHIHLPENKTTRDYQAMFEDIAHYLMGRKPSTE
jgi:hypothetical protein